ncbi:MAG: hypothetical protein PHZ07_01715 [Patescibacteria group bacterium]|nr:hypothetical protein [Patescibacteria group bacterium]MDD4304097.1 hypothetical protein [Patescibacteria group bacterium]MDD4694974.1 hypothetical protein [Patescibacteria group bacterium]
MKTRDKIIFASLLILLAIFSRLIPHLPNFTPIAAISIFISAYISKKYFWLPILALFLSDIFIGTYDIKLMSVVYISFIIIGFFGYFLREKRNIFRILGVSFFGSLFFFLTTNFAVWITSSWYERSLFGLLNCYAFAIPFFRNMVIGDIYYLGIIITLFEFISNNGYEKIKIVFLNFKNKTIRDII